MLYNNRLSAFDRTTNGSKGWLSLPLPFPPHCDYNSIRFTENIYKESDKSPLCVDWESPEETQTKRRWDQWGTTAAKSDRQIWFDYLATLRSIASLTRSQTYWLSRAYTEPSIARMASFDTSARHSPPVLHSNRFTPTPKCRQVLVILLIWSNVKLLSEKTFTSLLSTLLLGWVTFRDII